jgi:D-threo-aldose 1-dehydrogenase
VSPLPQRPFGRSGLQLTTLGLGGVPLAGLYEPVGDDAALDTVRAAYDGGVRYFDTAPFYGHGLSEHRMGQALRRLPRDSFRLSTKVGRLLRAEPSARVESPMFAELLPFVSAFDYSYDGTLRSLEDSLQRLGIATIDLVLVHDPNRRWHGDAWPDRFREVMAGAHQALERLRREGVIGAFGIGAHGHQECLEFAKAGAFDGFMLAGQYTLLDQTAGDSFLPYCEQHSLGVLLAAPFNSGILATGTAAAAAHYYYQPAPPEIIERVRRIEAICARHRVALPAAALQFPLRHPAVTSVVPGLQSVAQAQNAIAHLQAPIPEAFWAELAAESG